MDFGFRDIASYSPLLAVLIAFLVLPWIAGILLTVLSISSIWLLMALVARASRARRAQPSRHRLHVLPPSSSWSALSRSFVGRFSAAPFGRLLRLNRLSPSQRKSCLHPADNPRHHLPAGFRGAHHLCERCRSPLRIRPLDDDPDAPARLCSSRRIATWPGTVWMNGARRPQHQDTGNPTPHLLGRAKGWLSIRQCQFSKCLCLASSGGTL